MPVARRAADDDAGILQSLTAFVDVFHSIGEMAEVAAAVVPLFIPVPGQFHLSVLVAGRGKENQREAALLVIDPAKQLQAKKVVEAQAFLKLGHANQERKRD